MMMLLFFILQARDRERGMIGRRRRRERETRNLCECSEGNRKFYIFYRNSKLAAKEFDDSGACNVNPSIVDAAMGSRELSKVEAAGDLKAFLKQK